MLAICFPVEPTIALDQAYGTSNAIRKQLFISILAMPYNFLLFVCIIIAICIIECDYSSCILNTNLNQSAMIYLPLN